MLQTVLRAQLPLVCVTTGDVMNLPEVLEHLSGDDVDVEKWDGRTANADHIYWTSSDVSTAMEWAAVYDLFAKRDATLVIVNEPRPDPLMFDAGEVPTPPDLIAEFLSKVVKPSKVARLVSSFGGMTLHEMGECVRLTQTRFSKLNPTNINRTRQMMFQPTRGLTLIAAEPVAHFVPDPDVRGYVEREAEWFLDGDDDRLRPRGVLLEGVSGTGKTESARYIAKEWGVPLFRLDSTVQSKWQGESEWYLTQALRRVEQFAPCVLLVDEVEKLYAGDNEVVQRMLGEFLWWMQESRARVFKVLTANDTDKLPSELIRPGRVDRTFHLPELDDEHRERLVKRTLSTFRNVDITRKSVYLSDEDRSPAAVVARVLSAVKQHRSKHKEV